MISLKLDFQFSFDFIKLFPEWILMKLGFTSTNHFGGLTLKMLLYGVKMTEKLSMSKNVDCFQHYLENNLYLYIFI